MTNPTNPQVNIGNSESLISRVAFRLKRPDMAQLLLLFFVVITVTVIAAWPENPQSANNSWAVLAQSKLALLVFFAALFGGLARAAGEKLLSLIALCCFHLFSLPLDAATYAASFPEVNFLWALSLPLIALFSYFMLGHFCSGLFHRLGLSIFALPVAVLLPIAAIFADIYLGRNLFNPFNSIALASTPYIIINLGISIVGLFVLVRQALKNSQV